MRYTKSMYTTIRTHKNYMQAQLANNPSSAAREQLYHYHLARVRDFQHERAIHLAVTLFFAFLLLLSVTALVCTPLALPTLAWPLGALTVILFTVQVFYVAHYYQLENGVQSLYGITEQFR